MHVFTSITANYLPKARVLATSLKRFHPEAAFHLVYADSLSGVPAADLRVFDSVVTLDELPIPDLPAWLFQHTVVELCTAVKGVAARELLDRHGGSRLYYFDPDIAIHAPLDGLEAYLDKHSFILTPHQCTPEEETGAILDNEIGPLKYGVFNLGFLGLRLCPEGRRFLDWWAERLLSFCFDDIPGGLFTDQRWIDLAPAFFPGVGIVRDPEYNVATWNLTQRKATGTAPEAVLVEGRPLCFFHFSGFDSGAQEIMLKRYGADSPVLFDLRDWYVAECARLGQARYEGRKWHYGFFDDGTPITKDHRLVYRSRADVRAYFPNPFVTDPPDRSYRHWYENEVTAPARARAEEQAAREARLAAQQAQLAALEAQLAIRESQYRLLEARVAEKQAELSAILSSRSWRVARRLSRSWHGLKNLSRHSAVRS